MGIHGLMKVLGDHAPKSIKENEFKTYFGRKVAIDASMSLYQFLIAVRSEGQQLTNEAGEITSHLTGFFYRTIRMIDSGIKPVYVFDGKPPTLKSGELEKRVERRKEAEESLKAAQEEGDTGDIDKFSRRLVRVTKEHNDECKKLLKLMGVPYIEAPCEAEAQCASMCKAGLVYATASEDMDSLTFGTPVLLRHLTFSEAKKLPITEISFKDILASMEMTHDQFVDLCILLGCDYCDSIKGIGPKKAFEYIKSHKDIESVIKSLDKTKYTVPENWNYEGARKLFKEHEVLDPSTLELKWEEPDEEGLVQFMVKEKGFNEERIRNGVKKLMKSRSTQTQGRLDGFFKVLPQDPSTSSLKRKADDDDNKKKGGSKKVKTAAKGKGGRGAPRK